MTNMTKTWRNGACLAAGLLAAVSMVGAAPDAPQSLDAIRETAQVFVRQSIPGESAAVQVSVGNLDPRLRLAACTAPLQASLPSGVTFSARTTIAVTCPGDKRWTVYVPVSIETHVSSLILRHAAARGDRLSAEDVEVQNRTVPGTSASYLANPAELAGRTLKRSLGAGSVLTADAFVTDSVIKRGQQVTLLAAVGGIEVRAMGRALSDGKSAERVRVQNLQSQTVVEGVVESSSVIRITP